MQSLAVVVLYQQRIHDSVTVGGLLREIASEKPGSDTWSVLIFDNSPQPQQAERLPPCFAYHHSPNNEGVAGAYNHALSLAQQQGCEWLLTLDQDSRLPPEFLSRMSDAARSLGTSPQLAAIVPQAFHNDRLISPHQYVFGAWPRFLPAGFRGACLKGIFAINSGSFLRVSALHLAQGFEPAFWLDASDHVLFARLGRLGFCVAVLGDLHIKQNLSHLDEASPLSPDRLRNTLLAESAFWDAEMSRFAGAMRTVVMFRHLCGMLRRREDPALRRLVLTSIFDRILHTRAHRLRRWRHAARQRFGE